MNQAKRITEEEAILIRRVTSLSHALPKIYPNILTPKYKIASGQAHCRLCGHKINKGDTAIIVRYNFTTRRIQTRFHGCTPYERMRMMYGYQKAWIHINCRKEA